MYMPGDLVAGTSVTNSGLRNCAVTCSPYKEVMLNKILSGYSFTEEYKNFTSKAHSDKQKLIYANEIGGMVVDTDLVGTEKAFRDGIVAVLIKDKILWFFAKDLKLIKLSNY